MEDIVKTNNTAKPIPVAEEIFLDTPKYGQIPSVRERTIFCEIIAVKSILMIDIKFIIHYPPLLVDLLV